MAYRCTGETFKKLCFKFVSLIIKKLKFLMFHRWNIVRKFKVPIDKGLKDSGCTRKNQWRPQTRTHKDTVPTPKILVPLINLLIIIPRSTSEAERGFSAMNMICKDLRNKLSIEITSCILFIKINGPSINFLRRNMSRVGKDLTSLLRINATQEDNEKL